jgi:activator of HSP90 ATPase
MKNYKKQYIIKALPQDVYAALTNPSIIAIWTGEEAVMETVPDTEFSWWDGDICGKNLEFEADKKIVQQWYFGEDDDASASIVTLKMHPDKKGTSLEISHTNIPDEAFDNIAEGWEEAVIVPLRDLLEE